MPESSRPKIVLAFDFGLRRIGVACGDSYSSLEAEARLQTARESGLRRRRLAKSDIDAAAACVILERWFTEKTGSS
jgi:RNase H-fold protein (predicted Holliday junction resolvase)